MKRFFVLALALLLLAGTCAAEQVYSLPIDLSAGMPLAQENYLDENTYEDPTISMHVTTGRAYDTTWWMADVVIGHPSQLRTMPASRFNSDMTSPGKRLSARANAVLAVDGDFFSIEEAVKGSYVLRQGTLYSQNLVGHSDVLLIDDAGDFHVVHKAMPGDVPETVDGRAIVNALCFGPMLVEDGQVRQVESDSLIATDLFRARAALCQIGPLHYAVVCSRGIAADNKGLTLQEFADLLGTLDMKYAYNLDGGSSAMMLTGGRLLNTNRSLRDISDIVYFASAWPGEEAK